MSRKTVKSIKPGQEITRWDEQWEKQAFWLAEFFKLHGRWPLAAENHPKKNRLGQWANRQRDLHDRGDLDSDRSKLLTSLGFAWGKPDARQSHWDEQLSHLLDYRRKFPKNWPFARQDFPKGNRLGLWVWRQRQAAAYGRLSKRRKERLTKLGFPFELPDSWEEHFQILKKYRAKNPAKWPKAREEFPAGHRLGLWCHLQRCAFKVGKLAKQRGTELNSIGFLWDVKQVNWMRYFDHLKTYKRKNLKIWPVLEAAILPDHRLIAWCSSQRFKRKKGILDKSRVALLDGIGFRW